jgi:nucleoside phosphorylase
VTDTAIVVADPREFNASGTKYEPITHYCGIGPANAIMTATKLVLREETKRIINIGTAGAYSPDLEGLYQCGVFIERDLNLRKFISNPSLSTVSTGSKFVTELEQNNTDLVDMEAYWIAMACYKHDVQFLCYKYVSDYVGNNSFTEWENRVGESHDVFLRLLERLV